MDTLKIALIGDYDPAIKAHKAIPIALEMAGKESGCEISADWIATSDLEQDTAQRLSSYDAAWCVPGSPYVSFEGALHAIRFARERHMPFLGTCGGFQHALIEYARNVLGIEEADHAESNPDASVLFISPLTCSLVNTKGFITLKEGSNIERIYGKPEVEEEYNCSFGLNPDYRSLLESGDMIITGVDENDEVRVVELISHPFFTGTLYQPERAALAGIRHPLVKEFVGAANKAKMVTY